MAAGEEAGDAAEQATAAVFSPEIPECPNMDAIKEAAVEAAVSGAVTAATNAGQDVDAARLAAEKGAAKGIIPKPPEPFEPVVAPPAMPTPPSIETPPTQDEKPASPL